MLLSVPLVWGTYAPAVRYLYEQPVPMPGLVFSAVYYVIALASLAIVSSIAASQTEDAAATAPPWRAGAELGGYLYLGNFFQVLGLQWTTADRAAFIVQLTTIFVPVLEATLLRRPETPPLPSRTWYACALAAAGVGIISADGAGVNLATAVGEALHQLPGLAAGGVAAHHEDAAALVAASEAAVGVSPGSASSLALRGDALVAVSAVLYSFHVLRLGALAPESAPLELAKSKAAFETAYAGATLLLLLAAPPLLRAVSGVSEDWLPSHFTPAGDVQRFAQAAGGGEVLGVEWAALGWAALWCGTMTCAYTIWAQSYGQRDVRPAEANLVYTSQPIFSACFAAALLGETMTPQALVGSGVIVAAVLLSIPGMGTKGPAEGGVPVAGAGGDRAGE